MACAECGGACDGPSCGRHAAGCYYGGPPGEGYWFAVEDCPLPHDGKAPALIGTAEQVAASWHHLEQAGLLVTEGLGN